MILKISDECQKNGKRNPEYRSDGGDTIFEQREAEVLLDGGDKGVARSKDGARIFEDGLQELQRQYPALHFDRVHGKVLRIGKRLHRELAHGPEEEECVDLVLVGEIHGFGRGSFVFHIVARVLVDGLHVGL